MGTGPSYIAGLLPGLLLTGVGVGLTLPTLIGAAVSALPPQSFSTGSGVVNMARQLGSVLGIALLVAALGAPDDRGWAKNAFVHGWWLMVAAAAATAVSLLLARSPERTEA